MKKVYISNIALAFLIMNIIGSTAIVSLPVVAAKIAKQDAWITSFVSALPALLLIIIICELGRKFPGMTLIEYSNVILGKWMGKLIGFAYFLFFVYINSVVIRQAGELIVSQIMQKTPVIVISLVFVMLAAYATYSGLEVISRLIELLLPWVLIFFTGVLLVGLAKADFTRILPVCGEGCRPILYASIIASTFFGEAIVISMYLPFIKDLKKGRIMGLLAITLVSAFLLFSALINTAVFGTGANRMIYPNFMIAKQVVLGGFLRIDAFMVVVWVIAVLLKISQLYFVAVLALTQVFNLKKYHPLVLPLGTILVALSGLSAKNSVQIFTATKEIFMPLGMLMEYFIPALLLVVTLFRGHNISKPNT